MYLTFHNLINADYHGLRGVVIRKEPDKLVLANPGYVRTGKKQMRLGGESDPRNKALMKMFNLINIGSVQEAVCRISLMFGQTRDGKNR